MLDIIQLVRDILTSINLPVLMLLTFLIFYLIIGLLTWSLVKPIKYLGTSLIIGCALTIIISLIVLCFSSLFESLSIFILLETLLHSLLIKIIIFNVIGLVIGILLIVLYNIIYRKLSTKATINNDLDTVKMN